VTDEIDLSELTLRDIAEITEEKQQDIRDAEARYRRWAQTAALVVPILQANPHWKWKDAVTQLDRHKLLVSRAPARRRLRSSSDADE
jgi:hypothetical protein